MARVVVLGGAESGVGAAVLAKVKGFDVFLSDKGQIKDSYADTLFFKGTFGSKKPLKVTVEITDDMVAEVTKSMVVDENTKFVD